MGGAASVPEPGELPETARKAVLGSATPEAIAALLRDGRVRHVLVAAGAGISVATGIPDFRTPGTGLYDNLEKYQLPTPESVFTLEYFKEKPQPFCDLAKELLPGKYLPTLTHCFIRLLEEKGLLQRLFTQNIDGLERVCGISPELLVEAHGSFANAHCVECRQQHDVLRWRDCIERAELPRCGSVRAIAKPPAKPTETEIEEVRKELETLPALRAEAWKTTDFTELTAVGLREANLKAKLAEMEKWAAEADAKHEEWEKGPKTFPCEGLIKPDIVFFGEGLPPRFTYLAERDGRACDLLLVLGTSLKVMPFAGLLGKVSALCPRLLINRQPVGLHNQEDPPLFFGNIGFRFEEAENYRDVHIADDCDAGLLALCRMIGWDQELQGLASKAMSSVSPGAFEEIAKSGQQEQPFEEVAAELATELFEAIRLLPKLSEPAEPVSEEGARLSKESALAAEMRLSGCDAESLAISWPDDKDTFGHEDFAALAKDAYAALGEKAFRSLVMRQTWCLGALGRGMTRGQSLSKVIVGHAKDACNGKTLLAPADFARLLHAISGREWPQERLAAELENLTSPDLHGFVDWAFADRGAFERRALLIGSTHSDRSSAAPHAASKPRGSSRSSSRPRRGEGAELSAPPGPKAKAKSKRSPSPKPRMHMQQQMQMQYQSQIQQQVMYQVQQHVQQHIQQQMQQSASEPGAASQETAFKNPEAASRDVPADRELRAAICAFAAAATAAALVYFQVRIRRNYLEGQGT
eukprot:s3619_g5.t1